MNGKKLLALSLAGVMSLGLLAGCGGGGNATTPAPGDTTAPGDTSAPSAGFNMSVCIASEPQTIDPALNSAVDGAIMTQHVFEGLMKWSDSGEAVEGAQGANLAELVPGQAETYDKVVNDDGTVTYTFHLRDGIKWSDGQPVTAGDFVYAWQRLATPATAADYCYMIDMVKGYDLVNTGTPTGQFETKVNADTGEKYHSNAQSYYRQIRVISDRLCRERGLSVLLQGEPTQAVSYIEWLRRSRGQSTFRSMLEEDLRTAIADANDLGHFFLLMEHMGYEISHGNRLGFRLRGQERFVIPGRKNPLFTEDGIRAAIQGNLAAIEAGRRPAVQLRPQYRPYQKYPRYTGFLALYVHYLYLLGKIGKRQYPPRMTPQLRQEVMRFEQYREQFAFLRDNGITTRTDMAAFTARTEETLANLMKQRTVLNVRRKRRRTLYTALADAEALAPVKELYEAGLSGMETEFAQYMDAVAALEQCGVPRERLIQEKAELYDRLAELNRQIRAERRKLALCRKTQNSLPRMEQEIDKAEARESEVRTNEHRRR